jgi:nucleotide-binding universal stress UspA family protein
MFEKILLPIDLHEQAFSLEALRFAVEQAQKDGAELHVLTILPHADKPTMLDYQHDQDTLREIDRSVHERLDALIARQVPATVAVTKVVHKGGTPHDGILRYAEKRHIDLIVMPSHDKNALEAFFMGSCAAKVVRQAHCSVMVLRRSRKTGEQAS